MKFDAPFIKGRLLRRYKRFLADVELPNQQIITAHTPNTGAMTGCAEPGSIAYLQYIDSPTRKYKYSWVMTEYQGLKIGIQTAWANLLVEEYLRAGKLSALQPYHHIQREKKPPGINSRFDLLLQGDGLPDCYVEVKNVTAVDEQGRAFFPDAASERARKHLQHLLDVRTQGLRAVLIFCVQREDAEALRAAWEIDPAYAEALQQSMAQGLEVYALRAQLSEQEIVLRQQLPVLSGEAV